MSKTIDKLDDPGEKSLDWLEEFSRQGIEYIESEAPELCSEIVVRGIMLPAMWGTNLMVVALVAAIAARKTWFKGRWNGKSGYEELFILLIALGSLAFVAAIINIGQAIVIYATPRLYILEHFNSLLR